MSEEKKYPVSDMYTVLDGYDIKRSSNAIVALVVVDAGGKKDLRLYHWRHRNGSWKVDLARSSVIKWNWKEISEKAHEFKIKYEII